MAYGSSALKYQVTSASKSRKPVTGATGGTKGINYVGTGGHRIKPHSAQSYRHVPVKDRMSLVTQKKLIKYMLKQINMKM